MGRQAADNSSEKSNITIWSWENDCPMKSQLLRLCIPAVALFSSLSLGAAGAKDSAPADTPISQETKIPLEKDVVFPVPHPHRSKKGIEKDRSIHEGYMKADFAFHGRVQSVAYGMSTPTLEGSRQPLTFVTYEIIERLSDNIPVSIRTITIKSLGGWSGGRFLSSRHAPIFNEGDEDILFVKGNGRAIAPVSHEARFRILNEWLLDRRYGNTVLALR